MSAFDNWLARWLGNEHVDRPYSSVQLRQAFDAGLRAAADIAKADTEDDPAGFPRGDCIAKAIEAEIAGGPL